MPAELAEPTTTDRVHVGPSAVLELHFALYVGRRKSGTTEWHRALAQADPRLLQRVEAFWREDGAYGEWPEIILLARETGALHDLDCGPFLARLDAAARRPIHVPPLPSEAEGVRELVQARLDRLRTSAPRRRAYVELLSDVWAYIRPWWLEAVPEAERTSRDMERRFAETGDVMTLIPPTHLARRERFRSLLRDAIANGEILVNPLALALEGQYIFSLPGMLLLGYGPEAACRADQRRQRGQRAANRFKVLSDPTRLALLNRILHEPATISDLADYFELSQPTVSVHVKMLRGAGLLQPERHGNHTTYSARDDTIRAFVEQALADLSEGTAAWQHAAPVAAASA